MHNVQLIVELFQQSFLSILETQKGACQEHYCNLEAQTINFLNFGDEKRFPNP